MSRKRRGADTGNINKSSKGKNLLREGWKRDHFREGWKRDHFREGWKRDHYADGSGALRGRMGREKAAYEYQDDLSLHAFVRYAEETLREKLEASSQVEPEQERKVGKIEGKIREAGAKEEDPEKQKGGQSQGSAGRKR